jgi:hypothetical protein
MFNILVFFLFHSLPFLLKRSSVRFPNIGVVGVGVVGVGVVCLCAEPKEYKLKRSNLQDSPSYFPTAASAASMPLSSVERIFVLRTIWHERL